MFKLIKAFIEAGKKLKPAMLVIEKVSIEEKLLSISKKAKGKKMMKRRLLLSRLNTINQLLLSSV